MVSFDIIQESTDIFKSCLHGGDFIKLVVENGATEHLGYCDRVKEDIHIIFCRGCAGHITKEKYRELAKARSGVYKPMTAVKQIRIKNAKKRQSQRNEAAKKQIGNKAINEFF